MGRFTIQHCGRNIIPVRNGEFDIVNDENGSYIFGRAVDALAVYEKYPKPGEKGFYLDKPARSIYAVEVVSITFHKHGHSMDAMREDDGEVLENIECFPGVTWFTNAADAEDILRNS